MKRPSRRFTNDSGYIFRDMGFYDFNIFDHDLILFCESKSGFKFNFNNLKIIGGRSAKPFVSDRLGDVLKLGNDDKRFMSDFLFDSSKMCSFFISDDKILMVFNSLFRSSGLGMAVVFDYPPEIAAVAIRNGDLEHFGERIYSPSLVESLDRCASRGGDHSEFIHSVFRVCSRVSLMLGESDDLDILSCTNAAAELIGCDSSFMEKGITEVSSSDAHSTTAMLLCLFSLCRRLSVNRGVRVLLDSDREHVKYSMSFDAIDTVLADSDLECIRFCEELADRFEMPLSIDILDGKFHAEFVPYRVDPSLYGLKAGVNIKINCGD